MARYDFISPGAAAGSAIEQFLLRRAMQEREQQRLALEQQAQADATRQRETQLSQQAERDRLAAEAQSQQLSALTDERKFRRAATIAELPPGVIDTGTADLLTEQGFGGIVRRGAPTQGAQIGEEEGVPLYDVVPGVTETTGGFRWQQAREQEAARAEQARMVAEMRAEQAAAAQQAQTERSRETNETRQLIAGMAQAGRGESRGLQDELTRLRIEGERREQAAAAKAQAEKDTAAKTERNTIAALATELANDPALPSITGAIEGRRETFIQAANADALSRFTRLKNMLAVDARAKLKGQGTISNYEAGLLDKAVSSLNRASGSDITRRTLMEIARTMSGGAEAPAAPPAMAPPATPAPGKFRVIRRLN